MWGAEAPAGTQISGILPEISGYPSKASLSRVTVPGSTVFFFLFFSESKGKFHVSIKEKENEEQTWRPDGGAPAPANGIISMEEEQRTTVPSSTDGSILLEQHQRFCLRITQRCLKKKKIHFLIREKTEKRSCSRMWKCSEAFGSLSQRGGGGGVGVGLAVLVLVVACNFSINRKRAAKGISK